MAKKKRAETRGRKPEENRSVVRDKWLRIRINANEKAVIDGATRDKGNHSDWCRRVLVLAASGVLKLPPELMPETMKSKKTDDGRHAATGKKKRAQKRNRY